jgi:peptide/nickel transport system substrate-binding protein
VRRLDKRSATDALLTFDGVYAPYLLWGANLYVMPSHRLRALPHTDWSADAFFQHPDVVSGPFLVTDADGQGRIVFAANPHYEDGRRAGGAYRSPAGPFRHAPYLEKVVFQAQAGRDALLQALRAQGADLAFHLQPDDVQGLHAVGGAAPMVSSGLRDEFLGPNQRVNSASGLSPPWVGDPRVLQALSRALDRAALVRDVVAGAGAPARGLYPRKLARQAAGSTGSALPAARDLAGARRLLDAAGWRPGSDGVRVKAGRRLEFSLLGICGRPGLNSELALVRQQWQELGAAVSTGCQNRDAFLGLTARGAFDMTLYSNQWAPDASAWAPFGVSGGAHNWNHCRSGELDRAFARGESTLDGAARQSAYADAERAWLADDCTIPLFEWPEVREVSSRLRNFAPSPGPAGDTWNAADWWLG